MSEKKVPNPRRWLTTLLALLLLGAGLLALAQGARPFWNRTPAPTVVPLPTATEWPSPTVTPLPMVTERPSPTVIPTPTFAERLIPTATPSPALSSPLPPSGTPSPQPATATPTLAPTPRPATATPRPLPAPALFSPRQRFGVVAPRSDVARYDLGRLGAGWYLQSGMAQGPSRPAGMEAVLFVGVHAGAFSPEAATLQEMVRRNPGTLWLVGNEPDVIWQGNATPHQYAKVYHDVYTLLKEADPTCQVAIGAISQVTPLRLRYLEAILAAYQDAYGQPIPVDVWNIHTAILREERGSWGVDIPPGLPDDTGILYEIKDNARIELLKEQVWTFRRWMQGRGERDKPLIVTEFSVLMPPEYGFPFETVRSFMTAAFDFLLTASDDNLGYPADDNRLVQRWAWYSLADTVYFTGNLFDPASGQITPLGRAFADYVAGLAP